MSEQTRKIITPGFLLRRLEAFRIVRGAETTYLLRDKILDKTWDFEAWQFFVLESLPTADSVEKMQTVFQDRFDRAITRAELDLLFGSVADRKLFDESAASHPLLAPFMRRSYEVQDGKARPRSFTGTGGAAGPAVAPGGEAAPAVAPGAAAGAAAPPAVASAAALPPVPAPAPRPPAAAAGAPAAAAAAEAQPEELPPGVQDALGLDWRTTKNFLGLFDPRPLLRVTTPLLLPLRHAVYAVPLLGLAALLLAFGYSHLLAADLQAIEADFNLLEHLLFVFVTVHVATTLTAATVAHHYKVSVDRVGVALTFGFLPRWAVKMTGADRLTRRQTMWLHGSTLIARVILFALGALLWFATRDANSELTQVGLLLMLSCAAGLLLESGNPLIKANGYYLLSAFLNERHLRGKAYAALLNKLKGGVYKAADGNLLALYGFLSATYVVFLILLAGYVIAKFVLGDLALGGSAMLLSLGFAGFMLWRNYQGLKRFNDTFERQVQFDRWRSRTLPVQAVTGEVPPAQRTRYWPRVLLVCAVIVLFLPYPYEPGGAFVIFPARRAAIATDTPGVITEVFFDGGESVKKGTPLARVAADDDQARLRTLDADIEEQRQVIANLRALPKPEEVRVAEQQLAVARSQLPFSRDKLARLETLQPAGAVTLEEVEAARKTFDVDRMQVVEKEAALALAKAGPTREQIASAEARLASLREQRAGVAARIERAVLRMPFDGNILSLHLMDRLNSYLTVGSPFAEVENTGQVTLQLEVVESDIGYVRVGSTVRARASAYFNREFEGRVTLIDRNVTPKSFGNVVKVLATFDNPDGLLRTGMAGQAKVVGESMPVWKAFTHSIVRFVRLQLWAWIP